MKDQTKFKIIVNNVPIVKGAISGAGLKKIIMAGALTLLSYAKINANTVFSKNATSALQESIQAVETGSTATSANVAVGPTVIYGRIQELGGTIKAINGKYLSIPVTETARKVGSPRSMDLSFRKSSSGGVLVDKGGTVHFVLKPSVTLPPRPYLRPAFDEHQDQIKQAMVQEYNNAVKGAK